MIISNNSLFHPSLILVFVHIHLHFIFTFHIIIPVLIQLLQFFLILYLLRHWGQEEGVYYGEAGQTDQEGGGPRSIQLCSQGTKNGDCSRDEVADSDRGGALVEWEDEVLAEGCLIGVLERHVDAHFRNWNDGRNQVGQVVLSVFLGVLFVWALFIIGYKHIYKVRWGIPLLPNEDTDCGEQGKRERNHEGPTHP